MKLVWLMAIFCGVTLVNANPISEEEETTAVSGIDEFQELEDPLEDTSGEPNVKELFDRFFGKIDRKDVAKFMLKMMLRDPDAKMVMDYLRGPKARALVAHIMNDPEYTKLIQWFHDHGFDNIYKDILDIHTFFGWDRSSGGSTRDVVVNGEFAVALQSFLEQLMEVLPMNSIMTEGMELYQNEDPAAVALLRRFREPGMADAWGRLKLVPEAQELGQALTEGGVALEIFIIILEAFFGWA